MGLFRQGGRGDRAAWHAAQALVTSTLLAALSACAPPPSPPTVLTVDLAAPADSNTQPSGEGAPILVRVYLLASPAAFEGAEFFRLYKMDAAVLGPDLIRKDEYLLAPGERKSLNLMPPDPARTVGVFAAYREFGQSTWRATTPVVAHQATHLAVVAGARGLTLTPGP